MKIKSALYLVRVFHDNEVVASYLRSKHFICLKIIELNGFYLTNRAVRLESFCSVLLYLLTPTNYPATHSHTAVNWLGALM